jgi:hypothetical protein
MIIQDIFQPCFLCIIQIQNISISLDIILHLSHLIQTPSIFQFCYNMFAKSPIYLQFLLLCYSSSSSDFVNEITNIVSYIIPSRSTPTFLFENFIILTKSPHPFLNIFTNILINFLINNSRSSKSILYILCALSQIIIIEPTSEFVDCLIKYSQSNVHISYILFISLSFPSLVSFIYGSGLYDFFSTIIPQ